MSTVPSLLESKKFLAALAASIISFFAMREGLSVEQTMVITGPLYTYIAAQGIADMGKERLKVVGAPPPPPAPPTAPPAAR